MMKFRGSKTRTRTGVALASLAIGGLALTACGEGANAGGAKEDGEVSIVYIGSKGTTFENAIFDGIESVDGVKAHFIEVGFDEGKQSQAIDDAVVSGRYDAIVTLPRTSTALIPAAKRAIDAGVKFVNVAAELGPDETSRKVQLPGQTASVVPDYTRVGKGEFEAALAYCNEEGIDVCTVARIGGFPSIPNERLYAKLDAEAAAAAGDKVKLINPVYTNGYSPDLGLQFAQDLLTTHPDVDVIIASDPAMRGVEQAVVNAGLKVGFVADGGSEYGVEQVKAGNWVASAAQAPFTMGELAAEAILRHAGNPDLEGETIEPLPEGLDHIMITKENVDAFKAQYQ